MKQPAVKALFEREPQKTYYKTMPDTELSLDCGYTYRPSTPINMPPPTPTLSHPFKDPHFPNIEQNDFQILDCKNINDLLSVAFCAVRCGSSGRLWGFCLGTPSCLIERLFAKQDMGTTNDRFLLTPDFYNDSLGTDFNAFLDYVEGCSERIKQRFLESGYDVENWKSRSNPITESSKDSKSKSSKRYWQLECMLT